MLSISVPLWKTNTVLVKTCVLANRLWNILLFLSSEGYCNYLFLNDNYYNVCKNEGIKHNTGIIRDEAIMENVFQTQSEDQCAIICTCFIRHQVHEGQGND